MKQIMISLFLMLLISCSVTKPEPSHYPRIVHFSAFDFTPFTKQGFLFTPEKYNFDYQAIGLINCIIVPEEQTKVVQKSEQKVRLDDIYFDDIYSDNSNTIKIFYPEEIKPDEVLKLIYNECVVMGADAFTNFKYQTMYMPSQNSGFKKVKWHVINGFAIKRLDIK
jgi:hypothetical protein